MKIIKMLVAIGGLAILSGCNLELVNNGGGVVTSENGEIECGEVCADNYAIFIKPIPVVLSATPDLGYEFESWVGPCLESDLTQSSCTVEMGLRTGDKTVEVAFKKIPIRIRIGLRGRDRAIMRFTCLSSPTQECHFLLFTENCTDDANCERTELTRLSAAEGELINMADMGLPIEFKVCKDSFADIDLATCEAAHESPVPGQRPDLDFVPSITPPRYPLGTGPVLAIDSAHKNFHTMDFRFKPFANMLAADGYQVISNLRAFSSDSLREIDILLIANAKENPPERPPVMSEFEVAAVNEWVGAGGALLLIVDHPPYVTASQQLAASFGFELLDLSARHPDTGTIFSFNKSDNSLAEHIVTTTPQIDHFRTATGSGFRKPAEAQGMWIFPSGTTGIDQATSNEIDLSGLYQGAILEYGNGRVAVFAEASGFTAQISARGQKFGMNHPEAEDNAQFVINLLHWLSFVE